MNLRILLSAIAALGAGHLPLHGLEPFENAPTFRAADLLPAEVAQSTHYTIDPDVPTDGLLGIFQLRTAFGAFECRGMEMLHTRLHELSAIEQIEAMSKTEAFMDAVKAAALKPVKSVGKIVSDPLGTVKEVPQGVGRLFGRVAKSASNVGKGVKEKVKGGGETEDGAKGPPKREDPLGYNKARNQWAAHFSVDPYTSNEVLASKLDHLAALTFGTQAAAGFGIAMVAAPLNMVSTVDGAVLTEPPATVRATNARRLAELGIAEGDAARLLENRWFTPTLQTRLVLGLMALGGVKNIGGSLELAEDVQSESEARFLCRGVELLGRYHLHFPPLAEFRSFGRVPAAHGPDGTLVVAAPVDIIAWTEIVAGFVAQQDRPDLKPVLCTTGRLTRHASDELTARGWKVHTRFLETPPAR